MLSDRQQAPTPEQFEEYLDLSREEIERLILYLLVQEALEKRLEALPEAVRSHARHFA